MEVKISTLRKWPKISKTLTANASNSGIVDIDSISGLYLFQKVSIKSDLQPELKNLNIIEFLSKTKVRIAEISKGNQKIITDLSAYLLADNAFIFAPAQDMTNKDYKDIIQETFERFPINAYRVIPTSKEGKLNSLEDPMHVKLPNEGLSGLLTKPHDEINITYRTSAPGNRKIDTVITKLATVVQDTLTLTYNAQNKLISVVKT